MKVHLVLHLGDSPTDLAALFGALASVQGVAVGSFSAGDAPVAATQFVPAAAPAWPPPPPTVPPVPLDYEPKVVTDEAAISANMAIPVRR